MFQVQVFLGSYNCKALPVGTRSTEKPICKYDNVLSAKATVAPIVCWSESWLSIASSFHHHFSCTCMQLYAITGTWQHRYKLIKERAYTGGEMGRTDMNRAKQSEFCWHVQGEPGSVRTRKTASIVFLRKLIMKSGIRVVYISGMSFTMPSNDNVFVAIAHFYKMVLMLVQKPKQQQRSGALCM